MGSSPIRVAILFPDGVMVAYESPKLLVAVRVRIGKPVCFLASSTAAVQVTVNHSVAGSIPASPAN